MSFAIVTEKNPDGTPKTIRSSAIPLTQELKKAAEALDIYLGRELTAIEEKLVKASLLPKAVPKKEDSKSGGDVKVWYALGTELLRITSAKRINGVRERRWLWEALENVYATERIKRASRGRTRNHFEYCARLAQFPREVAEQLNWAEWVYFFDSLTVRQEPRVDKWLMQLIRKLKRVDRRVFRRFSENLNKRLKKKDTSVLDDQELFEIYDATWESTKDALEKEPA